MVAKAALGRWPQRELSKHERIVQRFTTRAAERASLGLGSGLGLGLGLGLGSGLALGLGLGLGLG